MKIEDMHDNMRVAVVGDCPRVSKGILGNLLGIRSNGLVSVKLDTGAAADVPPKMLIGIL